MARGVRFMAPVEHLDADAQTKVPNASRFVGMPVGVQLLADWFVKDFQFTNETHLPLATPGTGDSDCWTVTVTGTTPVATLSDDLFPPHLILTNSGADNDSWEGQFSDAAGAGEFFKLTANKKRYFKCAFTLQDANNDIDTVTEVDVFIGFAITDTTVIDGATDFIGFHKADGAVQVSFVAGKDASTSGALVDQIVVDTGVDLTAAMAGAPGTGTINTFEFVVDGVDTYHVFANGVHVYTGYSATQLPDNEYLCPTICVQNGEAVAKILNVTKFFVACEE
jgi:hypothetical protein